MKYQRIYEVIEKSNARITDLSPWRLSPGSSEAGYRALWIVLEDDRLNLRLWVTHQFGKLEVTTTEIAQPECHKEMRQYRFQTQAEMAQFLDELLNCEKETKQ